ncbi:MAG: methionine ABC transporter ATP-binding protein [Saezia sp.]
MTDVQVIQGETLCRDRQVTLSAGAVSLHNVYKKYQIDGKVLNALNGINLEVRSGEIYGIIGRSGAGKSTLVRCINMLERPTSGEVMVGKWNMSSLNDSQLRVARRNIGMIFQHFNLLSSRTVRQNIALPLELEGMPKAQINRKVNELMELVGLRDLANKYVSQISGGQKQRVGIARALANNPQVLLSDEATSALDPETTRSTLALLEKLNKELGVTIIMITHQMEVVQRICDRVAVVDHGVVVEEGSVGDVFGDPKTSTTASLVSEATGQVVPAETIAGLLQTAPTDVKIWRISGHQADVLSTLIVEFKLKVTLIQALVEDYQGVSLGTLLVRVEGSLADRSAAREWVKSVEVEIEEIEHVE